MKTKDGIREVLPGQIIDLSSEKAMPFVGKRKITPVADPEKRLAVKIRSELLAEDIWLAFGDFLADKGLVIYYPDEIEYLKTLPPEEIKRIHRIKRAFRGSRLAN